MKKKKLSQSLVSLEPLFSRALSFTLPFTKIRLLDISYNRIKATGIQDLLNTIKKPYMLRFLSMWGNELNDVTNRVSNSYLPRL